MHSWSLSCSNRSQTTSCSTSSGSHPGLAALVIDGQVKFSGKVASVAEIMGML